MHMYVYIFIYIYIYLFTNGRIHMYMHNMPISMSSLEIDRTTANQERI